MGQNIYLVLKHRECKRIGIQNPPLLTIVRYYMKIEVQIVAPSYFAEKTLQCVRCIITIYTVFL